MEYKKIVKGYFISRPNRFVANVLIENEIVACHVKNTGRCKELLVEGATLYLEDYKENMRQRKLRYSVISVEKEVDWLDYSKECLGVTDGKLLINMDSQVPNVVVKEAILDGSIKLPGFDGKILKLSMERTFGNSRFDILIEQGEEKAYIEVKGVTLEEDRISKFPDAPTIRGVKHMEELIRARKEGYGAYLIFVVQMGGIKEFRPNDQMHKEFGDVLRKAVDKGVIPMAFGCKVGVNSLHICRSIKIKLYNI